MQQLVKAKAIRKLHEIAVRVSDGWTKPIGNIRSDTHKSQSEWPFVYWLFTGAPRPLPNYPIFTCPSNVAMTALA
jgi:hypothetical protein